MGGCRCCIRWMCSTSRRLTSVTDRGDPYRQRCSGGAFVSMWRRQSAAGVVSAEVGLVRAGGFVRWMRQAAPDYEYGRADLAPYEARAVLPARPYGVPVASEGFVAQSAYWLDGAIVASEEDEVGDDVWISAFGGGGVQ